jgi:NAD(P)-dependent dehydrogenase (short-subunit alcohol dehydrogenase family)
LLRGDVSKPADIESIVQQILRKFGRIDVLFANAGMGLAAPLEATTEDQIDTQFDVNFKGIFFTIPKVAPLLDKGGSIVVTTSFLNEVGAPGFSILSATKAAVRWSLMAAYRGFDFLGAKRRRLRKLAAAFPFQPSAALSVLSQNRRFDRAPMISAYPPKAAV